MSRNSEFVPALAEAILQGQWSREDIVARGRKTLAGRGIEAWLATMATDLLREFGDRPPPPSRTRLERFLNSHRRVRFRGRTLRLRPIRIMPQSRPPMQPTPALQPIANLPPIATPAELADWLGLKFNELRWFADPFSRERHSSDGPLRHYRYRLLPKRSGRLRIIEAPKPRLKALQRRILADILDRIPPHDAAHAYRPGRSTATYVAPHAGREAALHIDLREFFPSFGVPQVSAAFRHFGYPGQVAGLLAGICTNASPDDVLAGAGIDADRTSRRLYEAPHLPQGAPTSPALANLCAFRLDARLAGLAAKFAASYTRYADDLLFSGDREFVRGLGRFRIWVGAIAIDEGFFIRARKTRILWPSRRQQAAGAVFNAGPNYPRDDFDRLKATLHNACKHGPVSQNRQGRASFREHLQGKIAYVQMLNPLRGEKLRVIFERIDWTR